MNEFATHSPYPMIPFEQAMAIVWQQIGPLAPRRVALDDALGLALAEEVRAEGPHPPFAASTMDGYAIRAADGVAPRRVLAEQEAGRVLDVAVEAGTCVRIMTGAPLPTGADAVIPVELTEERDGWMQAQAALEPGRNVRPVGADLAAGQRALPEGTALGPAEIGLLASLGISQPSVYPRPRVAILATGDELVGQGQPLAPGQIRDSNSYILMAAVRSIGCEPIRMPRIADTRDALRQALLAAAPQADLVLTTGGVSMGTRDLVKPVLEELGVVHFGRVAIQPGKPLTFASVQSTPVQSTPVLGLPGNPVSTLVGFEMVVRPMLREMANLRARHRPEREVRLRQPVRHDPERLEFHRARLQYEDGGWWAVTTGSQSSSRLLSLVGADALLCIPQGVGNLPEGAQVRAILIHEPESEELPGLYDG
jgi:molybdopterin molybdotransferase